MADHLPESGLLPRADPEAQVPWDRLTFGARGSWTEEEAYDPTTQAKEGSHVTGLLLNRQADAETRETFFHQAHRLETALAVQNESQWKLELHPRSQHLTLHWLRIRRGLTVIDQLQRERMRLIQRETKLEHHVLSGSWTLLVVLNDVRPGDIIESAYTILNRHPINEGWCETFFAVPLRTVVGRYRFRLLARAGRLHLRCRSSDDFPARAELGSLRRGIFSRSRVTLGQPDLRPARPCPFRCSPGPT